MTKRLIAACFAVWLGFILLHSVQIYPGLNEVPADSPTISQDLNSQPQPDQPAVVPDQPINQTSPPAGASAPSGQGSTTPNTETKAAKQDPTNVNPSRAGVIKPSAGDMATQMLNLINAERSKNHLKPLILNSRLSSGANLKSKDMAINHYFSHTSPTYGDPFAMMGSLGITYRAAGENIARNQSVDRAHTAFMNSAGHRANILSPAYGKVGLGFYQQGNDLYVTQWFTD